jgi:glutamate 5-kinase
MNPNARLIPVIFALTPEIDALAGGSSGCLGTGGMATKLGAAHIVTARGIDMVIANGNTPSLLYDIVEGRSVRTRFIGRKEDAT